MHRRPGARRAAGRRHRRLPRRCRRDGCENPQAGCGKNAALLLALVWYHAGDGKGAKDMVVLPYKDSLVLFSKYLQQLVMESLGKELDLDGKVVNQGIAVYGNKGSTDQHAYVQQLRDGVNNFFATFIEVRKGREARSIEVEPGITTRRLPAGLPPRHPQGAATRPAASRSPSPSREVDAVPARRCSSPSSSAPSLLRLAGQHQCLSSARRRGRQKGRRGVPRRCWRSVRGRLTGEPKTADQIAADLGADPEDVYHCLTHLAANGEAQISLGHDTGGRHLQTLSHIPSQENAGLRMEPGVFFRHRRKAGILKSLLLRNADLDVAVKHLIAVILKQDVAFRQLAECGPYLVFAVRHQVAPCSGTALEFDGLCRH